MSEETPAIAEELVEEGTPEATPAPSSADTAAADEEVTPQSDEDPKSESSENTAPSEKKEEEGKSAKARPKVKISLSRGQELTGKVKTITDFGAFIDINLPQDGLVHISELSRDRVEKVKDVVSIGDEVTVWVKSLDKERNRISLTMRKPSERSYNDINVDDVLEGTVARIEKYGVFVEIGLEREGLVHVSELSHDYVQSPQDVVKVGEKVNVKVVKINKRRKQVNLSIKALLEPPEGAEPEEEEEEAVEEEEEVEMSTTMAAAFDRFKVSPEKSSRAERNAGKAQRDTSMMDDVINRTLKTQTTDE